MAKKQASRKQGHPFSCGLDIAPLMHPASNGTLIPGLDTLVAYVIGASFLVFASTLRFERPIIPQTETSLVQYVKRVKLTGWYALADFTLLTTPRVMRGDDRYRDEDYIRPAWGMFTIVVGTFIFLVLRYSGMKDRFCSDFVTGIAVLI